MSSRLKSHVALERCEIHFSERLGVDGSGSVLLVLVGRGGTIARIVFSSTEEAFDRADEGIALATISLDFCLAFAGLLRSRSSPASPSHASEEAQGGR